MDSIASRARRATDAPSEPYLRADWTIEEAGETLAENTGVGLEDWTALARLFIERLGPDKVSYASGAQESATAAPAPGWQVLRRARAVC
jgi:hypothetical protein